MFLDQVIKRNELSALQKCLRIHTQIPVVTVYNTRKVSACQQHFKLLRVTVDDIQTHSRLFRDGIGNGGILRASLQCILIPKCDLHFTV